MPRHSIPTVHIGTFGLIRFDRSAKEISIIDFGMDRDYGKDISPFDVTGVNSSTSSEALKRQDILLLGTFLRLTQSTLKD